MRQTAILLEKHTDGGKWHVSPQLVHAQRLTALHVLKPQEVQKWLTATAAAEPIVLGRPWFVAIQQQLTAVPNDAATLDDELRAAILQLKQAAPQYLSSAVRAVATLVALPGVDAGIAVDALVRASTASNRVVAETAMRTLDAIRPGWARFYQEHSNHGSPTTISNPGGTGTSRAGLADVLSSQAVLVGVSQYLNLPSVPHVENNLRAIAEVLGDRDLWGLPPERLRMLPNPSSAMDVIEAVGQAAAQVEVDGLLLVYFAGHGLLDERTGQPILALSGTSVEDAGMTGLPYSWIRESIESSEARHRVFILDCSFPRRVFGSDAFWRNLSPNNFRVERVKPAVAARPSSTLQPRRSTRRGQQADGEPAATPGRRGSTGHKACRGLLPPDPVRGRSWPRMDWAARVVFAACVDPAGQFDQAAGACSRRLRWLVLVRSRALPFQ